MPRIGLLILLLGCVTRAAGAETWVKVQAGQFTILSEGSEKSARAWATELEQFRQALHLVLHVPEGRLRPVTVVLFRSDRAMRPFKPLEKGKPQNVAGIFAHLGDTHVMALALDGNPKEIRGIVYHEAVHWHSAASDRVLPLWLEEGLAEVYSTFRLKEDGKGIFGETLAHHISTLGRQPRFGIERNVLTSRGSLEYNEGSRASNFYALSWLMTHYLLFGADTPGADGIARYLDALSVEADPGAAFQRGFGASYEEFGTRLYNYIRRGKYVTRTYALPSHSEKEWQSNVASVAEVERAQGALLAVSHGPDSADARRRLQRAAELDPRNPLAWQTLGEMALARRDLGAAEEYFSKAVSAGSNSYYVRYGLGATRLELVSTAAGVADPADLARSAEDFREAIGLNPRFGPAYENLAGLIFALTEFDPRDRDRLEAGRAFLPDSRLIEAGIAACEIRAGERFAGRRRLQVILTESDERAGAARRLADEILLHDDWRAFASKVDGLFGRGEYEDAARLLEKEGASYASSPFGPTVKENLRRARAAAKISQAVNSANAGRYAEARRLLEEVVASDAAPVNIQEARRLLQRLPAAR